MEIAIADLGDILTGKSNRKMMIKKEPRGQGLQVSFILK